mmetsp:Transcript_9228/g.12814  ORF Transcript_9228/g.12814 Transcript_9228/m.12814 type:complete len:217 (+) Transcript_9228:62-712(+)
MSFIFHGFSGCCFCADTKEVTKAKFVVTEVALTDRGNGFLDQTGDSLARENTAWGHLDQQSQDSVSTSSYQDGKAEDPHKALLAEKARLQKQVKDFAQNLSKGIAVEVCDSEGKEHAPHILTLERQTAVCTLRPLNPKTGRVARDLSFNVKDIRGVLKKSDSICAGPHAKSCVGLQLTVTEQENGRALLFFFEVPTEQEDFYTCFKIFRISLDMQR